MKTMIFASKAVIGSLLFAAATYAILALPGLLEDSRGAAPLSSPMQSQP